MEHEKIFTRENGTKYRLVVIIRLHRFHAVAVSYSTSLFYKEKRKRKWQDIPTQITEWELRKLPMNERSDLHDQNILNYLTKDEVYQAKLEAWELLKPKH